MDEHTGTITLIVNGQARSIKTGASLIDLLEEIGIAPGHVVIQMDDAIVARDDYVRTTLYEGCRVEIVTLVGGG